MSGLVKGIFGGGSAPPVPTPPPPQPMPDLGDPAILAAQKKAMLDAQTRSGRMSTILTGDSYNSDKLGTR